MVYNPQHKDTRSLYVAGSPLIACESDWSQSIHFIIVMWGLWVTALRRCTLVLTWTCSVRRTYIVRVKRSQFFCLVKALCIKSLPPALRLQEHSIRTLPVIIDSFLSLERPCDRSHSLKRWRTTLLLPTAKQPSYSPYENVELSENTSTERFENVWVNFERKRESKHTCSRNSGVSASNGSLTCRNGLRSMSADPHQPVVEMIIASQIHFDLFYEQWKTTTSGTVRTCYIYFSVAFVFWIVKTKSCSLKTRQRVRQSPAAR